MVEPPRRYVVRRNSYGGFRNVGTGAYATLALAGSTQVAFADQTAVS
jgi:hypothetical protein